MKDWTARAWCPQCDVLVDVTNCRFGYHEYKRIRCPGTNTYEAYCERAQRTWVAIRDWRGA